MPYAIDRDLQEHIEKVRLCFDVFEVFAQDFLTGLTAINEPCLASTPLPASLPTIDSVLRPLSALLPRVLYDHISGFLNS